MDKYSKVHFIYPDVIRGDTVWLLPFNYPSEDVISVCAQLKGPHKMFVMDLASILQWNGTDKVYEAPLIKTDGSWSLGVYSFDVKLTYKNGVVKTILSGEFKLTEDISRCGK